MSQVIIIGAGAAGLAAARALHRKGVQVLILEARERIGGRIFTTRHAAGDTPVELGAEFVHGRPPVIFDFAQSAGWRLVECADRRLLRQGSGLVPLDDFWKIIERVDAQIDSHTAQTYDQFLNRADASAFEKKIARFYVEGFNAAWADRISAAGVALEDRASEEIEGDRQFRIAEGYHALVELLARDLPAACLHTRQVVLCVRWKSRPVHVEVLTDHGPQSYAADRVIITVPIGVLRAAPGETGAIVFDPPLTEKSVALERIEPGHVVKIIMSFRDAFWRTSLPDQRPPLGFALNLEAPLSTWWDHEPLCPHRLTGWAGGPAAEILAGRAPSEILAFALSSLSATFDLPPTQIEHDLASWHAYDWQADPFSRCAYSYPTPGGIEAARTLAEPLSDTLFFAGEATDFRGYNGTVHGAIESGLRAAKEVLMTI